MRAVLSILAVATAILLIPAASAHVSYPTDDGRFIITVGNQDEPVYTYKFTGLDLIVRENNTDRTEVPGVNGTLNATLLGPGGAQLSMPLELQFGSQGRYEFSDGYILTQPGIYKLRLVGTISGTPVDGAYNMPHEITSASGIMFPDEGLPNVKELDERLTALEQNTHRGGDGGDGGDGGPGANAASGLAVVGLLGALALVALRRRGGSE